MFEATVPWYDAIYAWKDYPKEARSIERAVRAARGGRRGGRLLDVACGTGRHLEQLRRSFDVTGLDISRRMLAVARKRNPGVRLVRGDMRRFDLGETFDVVVCLFSGIGYVRGTRELRRAIACMARHLEPGGVLLVEPWFHPTTYMAGTVHMGVVDQPTLKICRMNASKRRGRVSVMDMHHLIGTPRGVRHVVERHRLWLFTPAEHRAAFEAAGLRARFEREGMPGRGRWIAVAPRRVAAGQ